MIRLRTLVVAAAVAAPSTVLAAPVERRLHSNSLEASTFLWNDWNKFQENYHPNYVADDDPKTAWVEGAANSGSGEWVRINVTPLDKTTNVRLKIRNGYQKSKGLWKANARAKDVTVRLLPSKTEVKATLTDKDGWQELAVNQPAGPVQAIELAVGSVYEGTKYADLCISDVQVFATSETADNPAFEKSKHKELLDWRKERVAAAKLFAKRKIDIPFHTAYKVKTTDREHSFGSSISGMLSAASADPGFAAWKTELAIAEETSKTLDTLPRGQIAPRSSQSLIEVDGFSMIELYSYGEGYYEPDTLHLPAIDSVSVMFADQLRVLDTKDTLRASDYEGQSKCRDGITWVKRQASAENTGPDVVKAIVVGTCGEEEGREGTYEVASIQLVVYNSDGRLALVVGDGHIDAYQWAVESGKPIVSGGRGLLAQGSLIEATKQK